VAYSRDVKAEFPASLHQSSASHDPSKVILNYLMLKKHFVLLSKLKTVS